VVESPAKHGASIVVRAWEPHQESYLAKNVQIVS
jgi:hypothetical protein